MHIPPRREFGGRYLVRLGKNQRLVPLRIVQCCGTFQGSGISAHRAILDLFRLILNVVVESHYNLSVIEDFLCADAHESKVSHMNVRTTS
jgi:hypothetical protein